MDNVLIVIGTIFLIVAVGYMSYFWAYEKGYKDSQKEFENREKLDDKTY